MKVICILQNAWGDRRLPVIFEPNPYNKSAKVIRKMVGTDFNIHFCNTTGVVTTTANGKPPIDETHFDSVIYAIDLLQKHEEGFDLILVCGKQAEKAVEMKDYKQRLEKLNIPLLVVPHPASRSLSNIQIAEINQNIIENVKNQNN